MTDNVLHVDGELRSSREVNKAEESMDACCITLHLQMANICQNSDCLFNARLLYSMYKLMQAHASSCKLMQAVV
jgi:hypothetical protein